MSVASNDMRHLISSNIVCCERILMSRYQLPCMEAMVSECIRLAQRNCGKHGKGKGCVISKVPYPYWLREHDGIYVQDHTCLVR